VASGEGETRVPKDSVKRVGETGLHSLLRDSPYSG
jgi:hypothetical protein